MGHFEDNLRPIALPIPTQFDESSVQVWGVAYLWTIISELRLAYLLGQITPSKKGLGHRQ